MVKLTGDERRTLARLATGDTIVYSQDGDCGWFTRWNAEGKHDFVGNEIMTLRAKHLIRRRIDPDDDSDNYRGMAEFDTISDAGIAALAKGAPDE